LTSATPFESGANFKFRLRAKNGVGIGAASEILDVIADSVPVFMTPPVVDY
jgi:hypothetical protein